MAVNVKNSWGTKCIIRFKIMDSFVRFTLQVKTMVFAATNTIEEGKVSFKMY